MIGQAVLYAANRATHSAIESMTRRITWTAIAAVFFICALVFALIAAYWYAVPQLGPIYASGLVAGGCALIGIVCVSVPAIVDWFKKLAERRRSTMGTAVATVDEEAKEAVDYFGAMQVVATAFLFGISAARRLKQR